jgi:hypothetical protein
MTRWAAISAVRLPDSTRLTRYAFAMRTINARLGVLVAMLLGMAYCLSAQQEKTSGVEVVVIDQAGARIAQAQIEVVPRPENFPQKIKTDDKGHASLRLNSGEYALSVSAQGFRTSAQALTVSNRDGAGGTNQVVKVILKIADTGSPTIIYPPDSLVLVGDPYRAPVVLSPADFRVLPHITIKAHNGHTNAEESYSGVLLETLLAKANAPVGNEFRKEALRSFVLASGADGYSVLLSLAEIDSAFQAGQVIVADTRGGLSLGKYGPFQLIVPGDSRPARWVHNLNSIRLQQAQ